MAGPEAGTCVSVAPDRPGFMPGPRAISLSQSPTDTGAGQRAGSCGDPAGCQGWQLGILALEGQVPGAGCRDAVRGSAVQGDATRPAEQPPTTARHNITSPAPSAESPGASLRPPRGRKGVRGGGGAGVPRQSASEREKLRMRRLAQALLRLRHYLPPALAPAGQTLTKIETLRLATRYIAHLSALLGLGRGAPASRHCPLCPRGLGCCQDTEPRDASPPGTAGWGSPPMAGTPPELHGAPDMGLGAWGSPLCSPAVGTPLEVFRGPEMGLGTWGSPPYTPATGIPPELQRIPSYTILEPPHRRDTATAQQSLGPSQAHLPSSCHSLSPPQLHPSAEHCGRWS
ncbi:uncharacterized protein ACIQIH_013897 [Cyanocitta cristata]